MFKYTMRAPRHEQHQIRLEANEHLPRVLMGVIDEYLGASDCDHCGPKSLCDKGSISFTQTTRSGIYEGEDQKNRTPFPMRAFNGCFEQYKYIMRLTPRQKGLVCAFHNPSDYYVNRINIGYNSMNNNYEDCDEVVLPTLNALKLHIIKENYRTLPMMRANLKKYKKVMAILEAEIPKREVDIQDIQRGISLLQLFINKESNDAPNIGLVIYHMKDDGSYMNPEHRQ